MIPLSYTPGVSLPSVSFSLPRYLCGENLEATEPASPESAGSCRGVNAGDCTRCPRIFTEPRLAGVRSGWACPCSETGRRFEVSAGADRLL